jgi:hypothetical protein
MRSWFHPTTTIPLQEQLARLAENGVRLRPGVTPDQVMALPDKSKVERGGYPALLCALGVERSDPQGSAVFLSDDAWYFDAACITGPGAYAFVISRLAQMLPAEFPARDADDSIHIADWRASVSFELGDERLHWTQRVLDQWLDETLFVRINQLIDSQAPATDVLYGEPSGSTRRLWQVPLPDRQRLIVAATPRHGRRLAQVCGLALRMIV